MSYTDTSFSLASGYTAIHGKQVYDQFATQLAAHSSGAWSFVEQVNHVNGSSTTENYVWKCASAQSLLASDYYVIFQVGQNVTGTYNTQTYTNGNFAVPMSGISASIAEAYNSTTHVASKLGTYPGSASQTTESDGTNTSTWTLSNARPTSQPNIVMYTALGPVQASTTGRLLLTVTKDGFKGGWKDGAATPAVFQFYVGAFDSVMNSTDEPLPLVQINGWGGSQPAGVANFGGVQGTTTRHPKKASTTGSYFYGVAVGYGYPNQPGPVQGSGLGACPALAINYSTSVASTGKAGGILGDTATTQVNLFTGSVPASRCCFTQYNLFGGSESTVGGMRGYFKDFLSATCVAHSFGDTFTIDGKTYVEMSGLQYGTTLMDTTA